MSNAPSPAGRDVLVLGIETSCDETAAAVVARDGAGRGRILSNVVRSQFDMHKIYGGVVPEIAARAHADCLDAIVAAAMAEAGVGFDELAAVAGTTGPGLIGGLIVGAVSAKAIALAASKPFLAINHLEAHALTAGLTDGIKPPYMMLLVSGGHTQILLVKGAGDYQRLGTTIDDALGEAFDKTAKLLGLAMPGGPQVERAARKGNPRRFKLPRPMLGRPEPHFSFAGLKTAVRQAAKAIEPLSEQDVADLCASFEAAVTDAVADRVAVAFAMMQNVLVTPEQRTLVIAGGVAANSALKTALTRVAGQHGFKLLAPPAALCTDNGAMIAWAGAERLALGLVDTLAAPVRPRWPLDPTAPPAIGAGVKA